MNILIVDDEAPARQRLKALIESLGPAYRVVGLLDSGEKAVTICTREHVDVVLLDIRMPGMDGLEAARAIAALDVPPAIVFVTAHEEHALSAFEVHAAGYLLKPVRQEKLRQVLETITRPTRPLLHESTPNTDWLVSRYRGNVQRIPFNQVYYFRADHKYVMARHETGEMLLEDSLKALEKRFAGRVLRIHRNALVVPEHVAGLEKDAQGVAWVNFSGLDERLPVSRRHLPQLRRLLYHKTDND